MQNRRHFDRGAESNLLIIRRIHKSVLGSRNNVTELFYFEEFDRMDDAIKR
jgi:hypothetical protein